VHPDRASFLDFVELTADMVQLVNDKPTSTIQIAKTGTFKSKRYGKFNITEKHFDDVVRNRKRMPNEPPIDYNHLSFGETLIPDQGVAAGWIKDLEKRDDKTLWATVEWTPRAAKHIEDREFRYISPIFIWNDKDDQGNDLGTTIPSAALTNYPFLKGMAGVALSEFVTEKDEDTMSEQNNADIVKLQQNFVALQKNFEEMGTKLTETHAKLVETSGKVVTLTAELEVQKTENAKLVDQIKKNDAESKVAALIRQGKIVPKQKDTMVELAVKDPEFFVKLTADLPVVVKLNASHGTNDGDTEANEFDANADGDPIKLFDDKVAEWRKDNPKASPNEAVMAVDKANPGLYEKRRIAFARLTAVNDSSVQ
jgi:phage I-like protein